MIKKILLTSAALCSMCLAGSVMAVSDAAKIGANAGAMGYCKDKYGAGSDKSKYNLLKIKTLGVYDELDGDDKARALAMKKAAEDGDYLGDPLTKDRCDSLRKMLYLKYAD
jgi:hypothetical protein